MAQRVPKSEKQTHRVAGTLFRIIGAVVLVGTVAFATMVYRSYRELQAAHNISNLSSTAEFTNAGLSMTPDTSIVDRQVVETANSPSLGPTNAKVTIVEFGDFQCPFSRASVETMKQLLAKYGNNIRFIFRNFPNATIHENATSAAIAASCAQAQGKFWQFYDLLFLNQDNLTPDIQLSLAQQVRLDIPAFQQCIASQLQAAKVADDYQAGATLGVSGTPTWFINGHRVEGAIPLKTFEKIVDYGLKGKL